MSYIFSQALVEEYSPANCLGTDASVPSNANHTHKPCLWHDKTMEPSRLSRFGMTCAPFEANHGEELLMSFVAAFRAKTSAQPEAAQELTANDPDYGAKWPVSSVRYDHASSSWKTAHCLWEEDLPWCSVTLPKWGSMRNGHVFQHPTLTRPINATASGLWPTPQAMPATSDLNFRCSGDGRDKPNKLGWAVASVMWPTPTVCGNYNRKGASATSGDGLATAVATSLTMSDLVSTDAPIAKAKMYPTATATATAYKGWSPNHNRADTDDRLDYTIDRQAFSPGQQTPPMHLNPDWVEWLMGWPIGHTDLKPLAMDKFHEWQRQHSPFFQGKNKEQAA